MTSIGAYSVRTGNRAVSPVPPRASSVATTSHSDCFFRQNFPFFSSLGKGSFAAYSAGQAPLDQGAESNPPAHIRYQHERMSIAAMKSRSDDFLRMMQVRKENKYYTTSADFRTLGRLVSLSDSGVSS